MRNQKSLFDSLLTERERLLLRFSDKHVIDSNSDFMASLNDSESDLLEDVKKGDKSGIALR